jgi:hypothetical protein
MSSRLATTNGHHGVDGLETSHHGLVDGATGQDTRSLERGTATLGSLDGPLPSMGSPRASTTRPRRPGPTGDIDNLASTFNVSPFLNETIVTEDGDTNVVGFQVQAHATDTRGEFHHLFG